MSLLSRVLQLCSTRLHSFLLSNQNLAHVYQTILPPTSPLTYVHCFLFCLSELPSLPHLVLPFPPPPSSLLLWDQFLTMWDQKVHFMLIVQAMVFLVVLEGLVQKSHPPASSFTASDFMSAPESVSTWCWKSRCLSCGRRKSLPGCYITRLAQVSASNFAHSVSVMSSHLHDF